MVPKPTAKDLVLWVITNRLVKLIFIFYTILSIIITLTHLFKYLTDDAPKELDPIKRTYDTNRTSPLNDMNYDFRFSKIHSKTSKLLIKGLYPYYFHGDVTPEKGDITMITSINKHGLEDLIRLVDIWQGPISAVLHLPTLTYNDQDPEIAAALKNVRDICNKNKNIKKFVDIHLMTGPVTVKKQSLQSKPNNFHLNYARFFSRSDYVFFLEKDVWPMKNTREIIKSYNNLLSNNEVLIIPTFKFTENSTDHHFPTTKKDLVKHVSKHLMGLKDNGWSLNEGPTNYKSWVKGELYNITKNYDIYYQPNFVINKKTTIPWCSERFDIFEFSKAACLLQIYLSGSGLYVLPDTYLIFYQYNKASYLLQQDEKTFEKMIKNRMYFNFYRETCINYARAIDSLGQWNSLKAKNIRKHCKRIVMNWGKGLIEKI
ncbi:14201_t:CDS:2 [Entrophospora sp. SA101]|nr:9616_t:CDS:2 [Entrophospora sp. SA101]CAJ0828102.1 14201_t:CDS:2 [Entrophospora sp. SA101]